MQWNDVESDAQVQLSQLSGSHDELTLKCDRQRTQTDLSADDEVLLTAPGKLIPRLYYIILYYCYLRAVYFARVR